MLIHLANLDDQLSHIQQLDTSLPKNNASLDDMWSLAEAVCEPLINPLPYLFNPGTWDAYADALGGRYEDGKLRIESIDCVWRGYVGLITGCLQESNSSYPIEWKDDSLGTVGARLLGRSSLPSLDAIETDSDLHYLLYVLFATRSMKTSELGLRVAMSDGSFVERFSSYWKAVLWFHCSGYKRGTVDYARAAVESESKPGKRRHALLLWWISQIESGADLTELVDVTKSMLDELAEPCEFRGSGRLPTSSPLAPSASTSNRQPKEILPDLMKYMSAKKKTGDCYINEAKGFVYKMIGTSELPFDFKKLQSNRPLRVFVHGKELLTRLRIIDVIACLSGFKYKQEVCDRNSNELKNDADLWFDGRFTLSNSKFQEDTLLIAVAIDSEDQARAQLLELLRYRVGNKGTEGMWPISTLLDAKNSTQVQEAINASCPCPIVVDANAIGIKVPNELQGIHLEYKIIPPEESGENHDLVELYKDNMKIDINKAHGKVHALLKLMCEEPQTEWTSKLIKEHGISNPSGEAGRLMEDLVSHDSNLRHAMSRIPAKWLVPINERIEQS